MSGIPLSNVCISAAICRLLRRWPSTCTERQTNDGKKMLTRLSVNLLMLLHHKVECRWNFGLNFCYQIVSISLIEVHTLCRMIWCWLLFCKIQVQKMQKRQIYVWFSATGRTCNILEMGLELNWSQINQIRCFIFKELNQTTTHMQKKMTRCWTERNLEIIEPKPNLNFVYCWGDSQDVK